MIVKVFLSFDDAAIAKKSAREGRLAKQCQLIGFIAA
jgi:hypothetical protein